MQRAPRFLRQRPARFAVRRRKLCAECHEHYARYSYKSAVRADKDHTLCFRCFRRQKDRARSRLMGMPTFMM